MQAAVLVAVVCVVGAAFAASIENNGLLLRQSIVEEVNAAGASWKAGMPSRFESMRVVDFKRSHLGVLSGGPRLPPRDVEIVPNAPDSFDARQQWPSCTTISTIYDQGHCGSCWAFGAVEAFQDRVCVAKKEVVELSFEDLVACCSSCGMGCNGGYPSAAWSYFSRTGVVSAGCSSYFDKQGCHHPGCQTWPTPKCNRTCENAAQWSQDKHFTSDAYSIHGVDRMMSEIMTKGPIEVAFTVYEDFAHYTSGIYHHVSGGVLGGHAVKIIGWGVESGQKYWLVANSWNTSWGEQGYFRIRRGNDECGIESEACAGTPK